jgi:hypothetical protein
MHYLQVSLLQAPYGLVGGVCQLNFDRIRRLRCDEEKPACKRCTSTGRICDGYVSANPVPGAQSSSSTSFDERRTFPDWQLPIDTGCAGGSLAATPANVGGDARLLLPKLDPAELRSYRYYIEIVGPSVRSPAADRVVYMGTPMLTTTAVRFLRCRFLAGGSATSVPL